MKRLKFQSMYIDLLNLKPFMQQVSLLLQASLGNQSHVTTHAPLSCYSLVRKRFNCSTKSTLANKVGVKHFQVKTVRGLVNLQKSSRSAIADLRLDSLIVRVI